MPYSNNLTRSITNHVHSPETAPKASSKELKVEDALHYLDQVRNSNPNCDKIAIFLSAIFSRFFADTYFFNKSFLYIGKNGIKC